MSFKSEVIGEWEDSDTAGLGYVERLYVEKIDDGDWYVADYNNLTAAAARRRGELLIEAADRCDELNARP